MAEQLRQSHQLLDAVFDSSAVLIAVLDPDMNFIRVNRAYAAADGKRPEDFPGKNHFALYPNAENEAIFRRAARTGEPVSFSARPFEYANNPERGVSHWDWMLTPVRDPDGNVTRLVLSLLNVSERIRAMEALGRREQELQALNETLEQRVRERTAELAAAHGFTATVLETLAAPVVVLDRAGRIVRFNRACEEVSGYRADEVLGRCVWEFLVPPEERDAVRAVFDGLIAGHHAGQHENDWQAKDGRRRRIMWSNSCVTAAGGEVQYVVGTGIDVTERRLAESALRESEVMFRQLAENIREVFWLVSPDRRTLYYVSPAFERVWGRSSAEVVANPRMFLDALHPEDRARVEAEIASQRSGEFLDHYDQEFRIVRPDGEVRWIHSRYSPIRDESGRVDRIAGISEDVTGRKQAEAERLAYAEQQRDALVREVHHRIKNNLQGIVGLLRRQTQEHPGLAGSMESAIAQVSAMAVVHGLQGQSHDKSLLLCELAQAVCRSVASLSGTPVEPVVRRAALRPVPVARDEAVAVALILNELVMNAVKHGRAAAGEPVVVGIDRAEDEVVLRVVNRGGVLPADFDLERGAGLGTGLSLVRSLLPREAARLVIGPEHDRIVAEFRLRPPIVMFPAEAGPAGDVSS